MSSENPFNFKTAKEPKMATPAEIDTAQAGLHKEESVPVDYSKLSDTEVHAEALKSDALVDENEVWQQEWRVSSDALIKPINDRLYEILQRPADLPEDVEDEIRAIYQGGRGYRVGIGLVGVLGSKDAVDFPFTKGLNYLQEQGIISSEELDEAHRLYAQKINLTKDHKEKQFTNPDRVEVLNEWRKRTGRE